MINDWPNITRIVVTGAERLYPNGIDWIVAPGVNAIVGGTGLGKTTLVYAIQFAIFGKFVTNSGERIECQFFNDRLTKRTGEQLEKDPPLICVDFSAARKKFSVTRNLLTGAMTKIICDGSSIRPKNYEEILTGAVGIESDFQGLVRLQSNLFFFGEIRFLLVWNNLLQHELINLLMSDHDTYQRLRKLWKKVESADSAARNLYNCNQFIIEVKWIGKSLSSKKENEEEKKIITAVNKKITGWFTEYNDDVFSSGSRQLAKYFSSGLYGQAYLVIFDCMPPLPTRKSGAYPLNATDLAPHNPLNFNAFRACVDPLKASKASKVKKK